MPRHQAIDDCPYTPPQPTGARCPGCGALVLVREYREGVYVELAPALTPVLGEVHECDRRKEAIHG